MTEDSTKDEYEDVIAQYYKGEKIHSLITLKVDTQEVDNIANAVTEMNNVNDVFLVTGDTDMVLGTVFNSYKELKDFIIDNLGALRGVKETNTLMIVSTYKKSGIKIEAD